MHDALVGVLTLQSWLDAWRIGPLSGPLVGGVAVVVLSALVSQEK